MIENCTWGMDWSGVLQGAGGASGLLEVTDEVTSGGTSCRLFDLWRREQGLSGGR